MSAFQLAACENGQLTSELSAIPAGTETHPVFFENKNYIFDVVFTTKPEGEPFVYSPLKKEIKEAFLSRTIGNSYVITGGLSITETISAGLHLTLGIPKNGALREHILGFEVYPVKLDYRNDYRAIIREINVVFFRLWFLKCFRKHTRG